MAELAGYLNQVFVLAGSTPMSGSTGAKVLGISKSSYNALCDIMEISQFGDTYKKRKGGLKDSEVSIDGQLYSADATGQAVFIAGNEVMLGLYPQGTAVAGVQIPCIIESVENSAEVAGIQAFKASIKGNGAPEALPLRP